MGNRSQVSALFKKGAKMEAGKNEDCDEQLE